MFKKLSFLLILTMIFTTIPAFAAEKNEVRSEEICVVASYHVWKHSNGNWQYTGKPGDTVKVDITADFVPKGEIKSVSAAYLSDLRGNFTEEIWGWSVQNLTPITEVVVQNTTLSVTIQTKLDANIDARNIKETDWQMEAVEGYRYYIPVIFTIVYQEEVEFEPPEGEAVDSGAGYFSPPSNITGSYSCWMFDLTDGTEVKNYCIHSVSGELIEQTITIDGKPYIVIKNGQKTEQAEQILNWYSSLNI